MKKVVKVLKKEFMHCSICGEEHEVELCEEKVEKPVKDDIVEYTENYYRCNKYDIENIFMTGNMWNKSLLNRIDAYRTKNNLLTSIEIKQIRDKYKVTQAELSFLLGLGEVTITRYETKQIQEVSNDNMLREINNNAILTLNLLEKNKERFSEKRYKAISDEIKLVIDNETIKYLNEQEIICKYINYTEESLLNGNCVLDINKLKSVLAYITKKMGEVKKVVLMKLLWYIDALSFKNNNKSITGLVYVHMPFGALPVASDELLELSSINYEKKYNTEEHLEYKITNNPEYKIVGISKIEKEIIDKVIEKFKNYRSSEISEYMHKENAYIETSLNEIISFEFAKELKSF